MPASRAIASVEVPCRPPIAKWRIGDREDLLAALLGGLADSLLDGHAP